MTRSVTQPGLPRHTKRETGVGGTEEECAPPSAHRPEGSSALAISSLHRCLSVCFCSLVSLSVSAPGLLRCWSTLALPPQLVPHTLCPRDPHAPFRRKMRFFSVLAALTVAASPALAFFRLPCDNVLTYGRVDPIVNPGAIAGHVHAVSGGSDFSLTSSASLAATV